MAVHSPYVIEPLGSQHNRKDFSCGEPSLDAYIQRQASQDVKRDLAVCYVLSRRDSAILGYYTLSASSVNLTDLPQELAKKAGRYALVPAVLLGRLAVDLRFQGQGLSALLLTDALKRALRTGVGVKLVIVDALNERAVSFYLHYEFQRFVDIPMRLYIPTGAIRTLFPRDVASDEEPE